MPVLDSFLNVEATPGIAEVNILIVRGDDTVVSIRFRDPRTHTWVDFSDWSFSSRVRDEIDGNLWTAATFITDDGPGGTVTVLFPNSQTALLTPDAVGVWDLEGTDGNGHIRTIAGGTATVRGDVT